MKKILFLLLSIIIVTITSCSSSNIVNKVRGTEINEIKQYLVKIDGQWYQITDYGFTQKYIPVVIEVVPQIIIPKG